MTRVALIAFALLAALFARDPVATLRLEAPFDELFQASAKDPDYKVDGALDEGGKRVAVQVAVRGHTSRRESECSFPKLKVRRPDGTTLKIGTHCGDQSDDTLTSKYGRVPNERSPWREGTIYQILEALAVPVLHAVPARITYVYPDARSLERNALLIEDDDDAVKRLGGTRTLDAEEFTSADQLFTPADASTLAFGQALIGNFDWCVKYSVDDAYRCDAKMKLWNVIAIQMPDGKARPLMQDFDVSGMVTGSHSWFKSVYNAAFVPSGSAREVEVLGQVQRTRSLFPRALLDATRERFVARKADAYRALSNASLDDDGRAIIREYMDAFFRAIETDEQFYRPVVVAKGTIARSGPAPSAAAVCADLGAAPVGTPVTAPLESRADYVKVVILDALWHWATPKHCPPIKTGAVWIPAAAISREFPPR